MCKKIEDLFAKIKQQLMWLSLHEVKANVDELELEVKAFLHHCKCKPSRWGQLPIWVPKAINNEESVRQPVVRQLQEDDGNAVKKDCSVRQNITPNCGGSGVVLKKAPVKRKHIPSSAGSDCGSNSKVGRMGPPLPRPQPKAQAFNRRRSKSWDVMSEEFNKELLITTNRQMPSIRSTRNSTQPISGNGCNPNRLSRTGGTQPKPPFRL